MNDILEYIPWQRLVVCLEESLYIHNIRDMKVLHTIRDTPANPKGICALSPHNEHAYLAYPGSVQTGEVQIFDTITLVCEFNNILSFTTQVLFNNNISCRYSGVITSSVFFIFLCFSPHLFILYIISLLSSYPQGMNILITKIYCKIIHLVIK